MARSRDALGDDDVFSTGGGRGGCGPKVLVGTQEGALDLEEAILPRAAAWREVRRGASLRLRLKRSEGSYKYSFQLLYAKSVVEQLVVVPRRANYLIWKATKILQWRSRARSSAF